MMPISQNDNQNYCTCDECKRVLAEEKGSQAGVLLRFVNAIATELKDEFPDVMFNTYAYQYTRTAPTVTKPADNVTTVLCTIESCFSHPLSENISRNCAPGPTPTISDDLPAWSAINDSVIIWDYTTNYSNTSSYFPNIDVMLKNVRWFAENNVCGVYEQGINNHVTADFPELRAYITAKILWNPYMSEEEYYGHIDDFLEGFYGPGWKHIRQYIDMAEECSEAVCFSTFAGRHDLPFVLDAVETNPAGTYPEDLTENMIRKYTKVDWSKYWNWYKDIPAGTYLETAQPYFDKAMQAAQNEEEKARIDKASLQIDCAQSVYRYYKRTCSDKAMFSQMLDAYFKAHTDLFSKNEQSTLMEEIPQFAETQVLDRYVAFNETLRDDLWNYGITRVVEYHDISNPLLLDFTLYPAEWHTGKDKLFQ